MTDAYAAGIDLGATTTRVLVADADGVELAYTREPTPRGGSGDAVTAHVVSLLEAACRDAGIDPAALAAVGIGSVGPLDVGAGRVVDPPNLPGIDRIDLVDPIAARTGADRVHLRNDAVAGLLGERAAAEGSPDDMAYVTISTGIGAGVIVDGHVLAGRGGNAGEVGHFVVDHGGTRTCGCGRAGHWEAYASGAAIPGYARDLHAADPVETGLALDGLAAADVFDRPDDPLAARVIDRVGEWNAIGVAAVVHAYAPALVVVGGGVAHNNPGAIVEPLRDRVPGLLAVDPPAIRPSRLGDRSVVRGALLDAVGRGPGGPRP